MINDNDYAPIAISWRSSFLNVSGEAMGAQNYRMEIISPTSNSPGLFQSLPEKMYFDLEAGTTLRFHLLCSDLYLPLGRYRVNYYKRGEHRPVHQEVWIVPHRMPLPQKKIYEVTINDPVFLLPEDYFTLSSVSWNEPYQVMNNRLVFQTLNPPIGTKLEVDYQPGLTRDQLLEHQLPNP